MALLKDRWINIDKKHRIIYFCVLIFLQKGVIFSIFLCMLGNINILKSGSFSLISVSKKRWKNACEKNIQSQHIFI